MTRWLGAIGILLFGVGVVIGAIVSSSATAQDTDDDRIKALETQVADLQRIDQAFRDINARQDATLVELAANGSGSTVDIEDRLLPEPRPSSDFGASKFNVGALSAEAVTLMCRAREHAQTYVRLTCDQIAR